MILSLHFFFIFYFNGLLERYITTQKRKKKTKLITEGRALKHRNPVYWKRLSNSWRPFSVLLVTASIGRNVCCPTYSSALPDACITFAHGGGKNRQARDLFGSTHSLRRIASVCVPCCLGFFLLSRKKSVSAFVQRHCSQGLTATSRRATMWLYFD